VVAWIIFLFGAVMVPVSLSLWVLGVICGSQHVPAEWCIDLGLSPPGTNTTNTSIYDSLW
jgi:hypothetical protein